MGSSSSLPVVGYTQVGCCGKRGTSFALCRNDRLNAYLEQLAKQSKEFDSAWLYREEVVLVPRTEQFQYIILYQRSEIKEPKAAAAQQQQQPAPPERVRRQLRLDWGRDGLSFMELDRRLPEELLIRSKVFQPGLGPSELLRELAELQARNFDSENWNSSNFCYHMIEQAAGKEYEYR
mmetsp:Transcript_38309/g.110678  ORF Transcript_38309/g.110678 Transcript_38309/m.110678 type:complete len:178 (-) Transcript_38309:133-666(-)